MYNFNNKKYKNLNTLANAQLKNPQYQQEGLKNKQIYKNQMLNNKYNKKLLTNLPNFDKEEFNNNIKLKKQIKLFNELPQYEDSEYINIISNKIKNKQQFEEAKQRPLQEIIKNKRNRFHQRALGNNFKEVHFTHEKDINNLPTNDYKFTKLLLTNELGKQLSQARAEKKSLNGYIEIVFSVLVQIYDEETKATTQELEKRYSKVPLRHINNTNDINSLIIATYKQFQEDIEKTINKSNTTFDKINEIIINIMKQQLKVGSFIELAQDIKNSKSCINVKNTDNRCLEYAILSCLCQDVVSSKKSNEPMQYNKYFNKINIPSNQQYPILFPDDITKYETINDFKINVYILDNDKIWQEYNDTNIKKSVIINLFKYSDNNNNCHFVYIKDIDRFMHHYENNKKNKSYHCDNCFNYRTPNIELFNKHCELCKRNERCECIVPEEGKNILKFTNNNREFKHPFYIVADFESTLLKVNKRDDEDDNENKSTQVYQKHVPNSYGLKYNCIHDEYSEELKIYSNKEPEEVIKHFIEDIERLGKKSYDLTQQNKENIILTDEETKKHKETNKCDYCKCNFTRENNKVKHHDHINGKYISTLCNECNLNFRYKPFIPIYLHNLKGYDSHLFIKGLYKYGYQNTGRKENIQCIPNNEQKYISFSKNIVVDNYITHDNDEIKEHAVKYELRFLDTIAFMASSLDALCENIKEGCKNITECRNKFKNTSKYFNNDNDFILMIQKGIYPYDYIDNYDKLLLDKLPEQQNFYSKLSKSNCSDESYKQATKVWEHFNCKTFIDYHNIYLKSDVLLLCDIWDNFREVCFNNYKLDVAYYYTAPSLAWDAMLKYSNIEMELITDYDQFMFIEHGIRGGISQISHRYAQANNKYMKEITKYDTNKEDKYLIYLDANNLYGWAMCNKLPYKNFKWNTEEWTTDKILTLDDESDTGYLFDVNLKIPDDKHDYFNNYTPLPIKKIIKKDDINKWQQVDYNETNTDKLCCSLEDRKDYKVNYRMLKLALKLGFELINVNRVLQYEQKAFIKEYIMLNTRLRTIATSEFEKDFFKLMNNSVFGKTMENVRNRIEFKLIDNSDKIDNLRNVNSFTIFDDNLVGVHIQKKKVILNKPMYVGQNILDDSKLLMFDFHYNFIKTKIQHENLKLLFTDTDSLCYEIKNQNIYDIIKQNSNLFDLSNFDKSHFMFDATNKKVIGKFKIEHTNTLLEFVGLRSKLYSYLTDGNEEHKKCKGVKTSVVKNEITHKNYLDTLLNKTKFTVYQNNIRSYNHQLYTERIKKIALSYNDDKVYICDDGITTYTHGHKDIRITK